MKVEMMNVSLTPDLAAFVRELVAGGEYTGQSEVVREALRLLKHQQQIREQEKTDVREAIAEGIAQLKRGEYVTGEHAREHFKQKSAEHRRKRA